MVCVEEEIVCFMPWKTIVSGTDITFPPLGLVVSGGGLLGPLTPTPLPHPPNPLDPTPKDRISGRFKTKPFSHPFISHPGLISCSLNVYPV